MTRAVSRFGATLADSAPLYYSAREFYCQLAPSLIVWGIVPRPTPRECMLDAQNTLLRLTTNEFSHYIGPNTIPVSHSRGDFWPA